jgi:hypothetical protein
MTETSPGTLRLVTKTVGTAPRVAPVDDSLDAMQAIVGGMIEYVPFFLESDVVADSDIALVVNEEGKVLDLPPHLIYHQGDTIHGNIFVARLDENSDFTSLTDADIERVIPVLNERDLTR